MEDGGASRGGRQGRASMPSTVHPEVLVVVDDEFFKGMDRDIAATQGYVVSFLNAVNMRFATVRRQLIIDSFSHPIPAQMTSPLVDLNIAGIVVAQSVKALPYIASHTSNGDMLDAPACLHSMGQYYFKLPT